MKTLVVWIIFALGFWFMFETYDKVMVEHEANTPHPIRQSWSWEGCYPATDDWISHPRNEENWICDV